MIDDASTSQRRWPWSAAATFVGLMWIVYGWSIWVAEGIEPGSSGMWFGSLTGIGYYIAGALFPTAVTQDQEWERLISSIFLHGGFLHILMNSVAIMQLGRILEAFTTRGRCWFTLLLSGLCGSLATLFWTRVTANTNTFAIGASGAGCGIGTALVVLSHGITALTEFRKQMITWVVVMLAMGLMPMISGTGHAGGAIGGAIAGLLIARRGSVRLAADRYGRALHVATIALTLLFGAALALNALRAPERKAAIAEIDAAINDIHIWLAAGAVPDVREWTTRLEGLKLPAMLESDRSELIDLAHDLQNLDGGKISPDAAERARIRLNGLRGG